MEDLRREEFDEGGDAPVDVAEGNLLPTGHSQGMSKGSGGQRVVEVGTAWFGPSVEHGLDDSDLEVDAPAAGQEAFGSGSDGDASDPEDSEASTSENSDEDKGDNEKNDNDAGKGKSDGTGTAKDADYMAVIQRAQLRAQGGRLHRNAAVVNIGRGVLAGRGKFGMVEQLRSDGCRFVRLQPWLHLKEISCGPTTVSALTYSGHMFTWKCGSSDAVSPARNLINSLFTYPPCPGEKAGDLDYEIIVTPSGPQLTRKGWAHVASGMRAASQSKKGLPLIHRDQRHDLMSLAVGKMTKTFLVQAPKPFFVFGEGAS